MVAGAVIGTCTAFVAFRQTFASVWDFRFNHVLLPRTSSLFFKGGVNEVKEGEGARLNGLNKHDPSLGAFSASFGEPINQLSPRRPGKLVPLPLSWGRSPQDAHRSDICTEHL